MLNLEEVGEVVINIVNHAIVEQMSLASAEFDRGVNEFEKAGFTAVPSTKIRPPRVAESPAAYECVVRQILPTGNGAPGSSHLIICEVVMAHFHDTIFDETGLVDPNQIDLVGRMGADWYCRAQGNALFEVARPKTGMGVDQIPVSIRNSAILSGNDLGRLGSVVSLPTADEVKAFRASGVLNELFDEARNGCQYLPDLVHLRAKQLLAENKVQEAWLTLMQGV